MNREPQSLTSLPASPDEERRSRMVSYAVSMGIRLVCLALCFVVPGWWIVIPATGAIFLPLVAVALANVANPAKAARIRRSDRVTQSITSNRT